MNEQSWDVIIIGAGHAGCEAAHACSKMGQRTLLLTMTIDNIATMSCNPAIGGVAKGHLVKEIDALGGIMGQVADETGIQFRTLNTKKGPAVQATRCQSDMHQYKVTMRSLLESLGSLTIKQREVTGLIWETDTVKGVVTNFGETLYAKATVITTGTFLNGLIHIGKQQFAAGRAWEFPSSALSEDLQDHDILMGRLKTGTTPRLNKHTIDYTKLEEQPGDIPIPKFSFWGSEIKLPQVSCHITYTNQNSHQIISENLDKSAMYGGSIDSIGPRYCPSIEDKIVKFPDKERHQIFLEPTSLNSIEIYPNGMSTSMPANIQLEFMQSIEGLEHVEIMRPGYAIEYDFCFPHQLKSTLELKDVKHLYFAGQINGTTGYEEAAAQGLIAGINAAQSAQNKEPFILLRNESYIGVLIDDLISKGTNEPYRMFTSRAEYRLLLREDNADTRLSEKGYELGLLGNDKYKMYLEKQERIAKLGAYLQNATLEITEASKKFFMQQNISESIKNNKLAILLKKPNLTLDSLAPFCSTLIQKELQQWQSNEKKFVETNIKYEGYIKRQQSQIKNYLKIEAIRIPNEFDYDGVGGLSTEVIEKLKAHRPQTLGQANKISGITPAAITILMVYLKNRSKHLKRVS